MTVIGIDPSLTNTGVAAIYPDGHVATWSRASKGARADSIADRAQRIADLAGEVINDVERIAHVALVVIEAPAHGTPGGSVWDRAGLWWLIVHDLVLALDVPVVQVSPTTRAKWATGNGRSDKAAVAAAITRLYPELELDNSDQADALALAHLGAYQAGHPIPTRAHHTPANLASVKWPDLTRLPRTAKDLANA